MSSRKRTTKKRRQPATKQRSASVAREESKQTKRFTGPRGSSRLEVPLLPLSEFLEVEDIRSLTQTSRPVRAELARSAPLARRVNEQGCEKWAQAGQRCLKKDVRNNSPCLFYCQNHYFNAVRNLIYLATQSASVSVNFLTNPVPFEIFYIEIKANSRTLEIEVDVTVQPTSFTLLNFQGGGNANGFDDLWDALSQEEGWMMEDFALIANYEGPLRGFDQEDIWRLSSILPDGTEVKLEPDAVQHRSGSGFLKLTWRVGFVA